MTRDSEQPEVIDPSDPRYRRPEDIQHASNKNRYEGGNYTYTRYYGCTPVGCLPGCLFSIFLSILLTLLLNFLF
ncbi:hypothetical protein HIR68_09890 [Staphylococcus coagulans]|uniref:hypothetical protein n=1 Tax=Staphylococcus coagulans TaxID=74706 RepID=UPI001BE52379|nr:hypothetical protein [Staphylococcus coagulans]MBT2831198.1 hypothetical protein [Staphylococcus coagulans]MBT2860664.1 hypothetical protein [Staphylococcus coagulans]MBU3873754.1 hypothetical protein [Staphylococcus coagulans]UNB48204.1 hypothetical protein KM149_10020 [Staphylococcus coagulans]